MAGLPLFKIGVLLVRTLAKPVAKRLQQQATGERGTPPAMALLLYD